MGNGSIYPANEKFQKNLKYFNTDGSDKETITLFVEAHDDEFFWKSIFSDIIDIKNKYKIKATTPVLMATENGKHATGCDALFSLAGFTPNKLQIRCVDSDEFFIKKFIQGYSNDKLTNEFTFCTEKHSIENIKLNHSFLDRVFERSSLSECKKVTKPSKLFSEISEDTYAIFIALYFAEERISGFEKILTQDDFYKELTNGFSAFFSEKESKGRKKMRDLFDEKTIDLHQAIESGGLLSEFKAFQKKIHEAGITRNNIYCFLRGHNLANIFTRNYDKASAIFIAKKRCELKKVWTDNTQIDKAINEYEANNISNILSGNLSFRLSECELFFFTETVDRIKATYN